MEQIRKPFQGVWNIIRFNWHFYFLSVAFLTGLLISSHYISLPYRPYIFIVFAFVIATTLTSLLISFYIYDISDLYKLNWVVDEQSNIKIININAGFDETSSLLKAKFQNAVLIVLDFYDPLKHTEVSIKRARKAYPAFPNTKQVTTSSLKLQDNSADKIFVTLAAHEIRDEKERIVFFKELYRILKPGGQIFLSEHLRDMANFLAYNIGAFHFLSRKNWYETFNKSGLIIKTEQKVTPFITIFTLEKYGTTP